MRQVRVYGVVLFLWISGQGMAQTDSASRMPHYKNVIRYNLSGALLFGADKYIVFGYERVISPRQSFSINVGSASLPKVIDINTDSFSMNKGRKKTGANVSVDYRFYLAKENKHQIPHGLYIGPYYSYTRFNNEIQWSHKNSSTTNNINTNSHLNIHTIGFELGYQFVLWKRLTIDLVMVGPGLGFYSYKAAFDTNIDPAKKEQILEGLKQYLTQKCPGLNFVFSEKEISSDGVLRTNTIGYRYIFHIGFLF